MARFRVIKPEFHTDPVTGQWSDSAKVCFIGLLNHCDDYGVIRWEPDYFDAVIFPYRRQRNVAAKLVTGELLPSGRVVEFTDGVQRWLWIPNFLKHQKVHTPSEPLIPGWDKDSTPEMRGFDRLGGEAPAAPPKPSGGTAAGPLPREERRGEEKRGEDKTSAANADDVTEVWNHFLVRQPKALLSEKRRKAIEGRLADGFTVERLKRAIDGNYESPFHCGQNDREKEYHELTLILRDIEHVETFEKIIDEREQAERAEREEFRAGLRLVHHPLADAEDM